MRAAVLLALAPLAVAADEAPDYSKMKVDKVFEALCSSCHGKDLSGGLGGSFLDGEWKHGSTDADLRRNIAEGNAELGMTPFKTVLSDEQIRALVIYIREKEKQAKDRGTDFPKPKPGKVTRTQHESYTIETIVTKGLEHPWAIAFLPDGSRLVTERPGRLRLISAEGKLDPRRIEGTPEVIAHGQGGLMEVAVHPDYEENGWIYLGFSDGWYDDKEKRRGAQTITAIVRGRIKDHRWTDEEVIWKTERKFHTGAGVHFGTRIVFDKGYIYFPVGERGGWHEAQDITNPKGKMYRLHDDGREPADNPYVGKEGAVKGLWTIGHRNPQGLDMDPRDGSLYSTEHGPRGGDELNWIRPGLNYGWPVITWGMNYNGTPITGLTEKEGMEQPVIYWQPSIAACGLDFYRGDRFPGWKHDLFAGALAQKEIRRLRIVDHKVVEQEVVFKDLGRVRDVAGSPDGFIYVVLNGPDWIVRLVPAK